MFFNVVHRLHAHSIAVSEVNLATIATSINIVMISLTFSFFVDDVHQSASGTICSNQSAASFRDTFTRGSDTPHINGLFFFTLGANPQRFVALTVLFPTNTSLSAQDCASFVR